MSNYPAKIDTDVELPRVDDNVSEIASEVINSLREAVVAVQTTLGKDPQGSAVDLVTRLSQSINDDGTLKLAALTIGSITNAQIASGAAILESKLDLDFTTQNLQDQITSNDIDIAALQKAIAKVISDLAMHVAGTGLRHDTFDIDLNTAYVGTTPPEFAGLTSSELHGVLVEMNDRYLDHTSDSKVEAHKASTVSVDGANFKVIPVEVDDVQEALESLDVARAEEFIKHRDHLHANGFDNWANNIQGYNENLQLVPAIFGQTVVATIISGTRNQIRFPTIDLAAQGVEQGSVIVIADGYAAGSYVVDDVGPRTAMGGKSLLDSTDVEIQSVFPDSLITDGYVDASVFGESSLFTFKGNVASVIRTSSSTLDSVQLARPNAAKVLTLGIKPNLISGGETLNLEVGLDDNNIRTTSIALSGSATIDSLVAEINTSLHGSDAFPAAAYRVGDELLLSHNWDGYVGNYIKVLTTGTANTILGFDGYGADVVSLEVPPTKHSKYYVNGSMLTDFKLISSTTADISGTTITFTDFNPEDSELKPGNMIHVKDHATVAERGSYEITAISPTTVTVHTSIVVGTDVAVEMYHDVIPLAELASNGDAQIIEVFLDSVGRSKYNPRLEFDKTISNLNVVDISDNFIPGSYILNSVIDAGGYNLNFGTTGINTFVPTGFIGKKRVYSESNIEFLDVEVIGILSAGAAAIVINEHINEEEVLEIATIRSNGLESLSDVKDKRLFGTIGLDEIREDVIQSYIEGPLTDLRSNGIVRGFDVITANYADFVYPTYKAVLVRGGSLYVNGVGCSVRTQTVVFPNAAGTYFIVLNQIGVYEIINITTWTMEEILDGSAGEYALIAKVVHDGANVTNTEDLRYFISNLDSRVDLVVDETNNFTGSFATFEAAMNYANSYPSSEKPLIRVVSNEATDITVPAGSREVTIQVDGYVNDVTIHAPCRLESGGLNERASAHIWGDITVSNTCTRLELDGVKVSGAVSITETLSVDIQNSSFASTFTNTGTGSRETFADNCEFSGNVSFTSSEARIDNSILSGSGTILSNSSQTFVRSTIFDQARIQTTFDAFLTGCTFENHSSVNTIATSSGGPMMIDNCVFQNMTSSLTGTMILISASSGTISNSFFKSVTMTGTAALISATSVVDSFFKSNTYTTTQAITVQTFSDNLAESNTGDMLVGARIFNGNDGIPSVGGADVRSVSGNSFPSASTLGYNVDIGSDGYAVIIGNQFTDIVASAIGITCTSVSTGINISNNYFAGAGATSTGIALTNATDLIVSTNTFDNCESLSTSVEATSLFISGNRFGELDESFLAGDNLQFVNNKKVNGTFTINTSTADEWRVINNQMSGGLHLIGTTLTNTLICENTFSLLTFELGLNEAIMANNVGLMSTVGTVDFEQVICSQNDGLFTGASSANVVWSKSTISENIWNTGDTYTTLTMKSDGSNTPALVNITQNLFYETDIEIGAANQIDQVSFSDNLSVGETLARSLNIAAHMNNSYISRNLNFDIGMIGSNNMTISLNSLSSQTISLTGQINSTLVTGNFVNNLLVSGDSATGLIINSNVVFNNIDVNRTLAATASITGAMISDNFVVANIRISDTIFSGSPAVGRDFRFIDCTISGNRIGGSLLFADSGTLTSTSVQYLITGNTVKDNVTTSDIRLIAFTGVMSDTIVMFKDNMVSGNSVGGSLTIGSNGDHSYISGSEFSGNIISGNNIMSLLSLQTEGISVITASNNYVNSNKIGGSFSFEGFNLDTFTFNDNLVGSSTVVSFNNPSSAVLDSDTYFHSIYSNISFKGNVFEGDIDMVLGFTGPADGYGVDLNGFTFSGNTAPLNNFTIRSSNLSFFMLNRCEFNDNEIRGISIGADIWRGGVTGVGIINNTSVIGNVFPGQYDSSVGIDLAWPGFEITDKSGNQEARIYTTNFIFNSNSAGHLYDPSVLGLVDFDTFSDGFPRAKFVFRQKVDGSSYQLNGMYWSNFIGNSSISFEFSNQATNTTVANSLIMLYECTWSGNVAMSLLLESTTPSLGSLRGVYLYSSILSGNSWDVKSTASGSVSLSVPKETTFYSSEVVAGDNSINDVTITGNYKCEMYFLDSSVSGLNNISNNCDALLNFDDGNWNNAYQTKIMGNAFTDITYNGAGTYDPKDDANEKTYWWGNTAQTNSNFTITSTLSGNMSASNSLSSNKIPTYIP